MNTIIKYVFTSSTGQGLSLTWRGIFLMLIPVIITYGQKNGYVLTEENVVELFNIIMTVMSNLIVVAGLVRKAYVYLQQTKRQ